MFSRWSSIGIKVGIGSLSEAKILIDTIAHPLYAYTKHIEYSADCLPQLQNFLQAVVGELCYLVGTGVGPPAHDGSNHSAVGVHW